MNKKKICKYLISDCCTHKKWDDRHKCPIGNTTKQGCKITPKTKVRRIKAWGHRFEDGGIQAVNYSVGKDKAYTIPCTILIDRKYLKGGK